jgi:hypothetical protein
MRLIIAEKYAVGKALASTQLLDPTDHIVYTFGLGLWQEAREELTFNQIPFTGYSGRMRSTLSLLAKQNPNWRGGNKTLLCDAKLTPLFKSPTPDVSDEILSSLMEHLNEQLPFYEEIVLAVDHNRRGAHGAGQILERLTSVMLPPVRIMRFDAYSPKCLRDAWVTRSDNPWGNSAYDRAYQEQKLKRLFEHWWHTNATFVFGELCKKAQLKADPVITKYEFMLMGVLHQQTSPPTADKLLDTMQRWEGTGLYLDRVPERHLRQIGSGGTQSTLVQKLVERGFAVEVEGSGTKPGRKRLALSNVAERFMSMVHPKTFDPDLPMRLELWMRERNIEAMRLYINTIFGRQLRYQRKRRYPVSKVG